MTRVALTTTAALDRAAGTAGVVAAVLATLGDLLLLYVANSARPEFAALPRSPHGVLLVGTMLGVLAIPLYGLGYWHVATGLAPEHARAGRAVFLLGAYGGALGGIVHGVTGLIIEVERRAGTGGADPFAVLVRYGSCVLPLWGILAALSLAGSALFARAIWRGPTAYPRWMALANPATLVVALSLVGSLSPWLRAFLLPAAPNVAHVVFFGATSAVLRRRGAPASPASHASIDRPEPPRGRSASPAR